MSEPQETDWLAAVRRLGDRLLSPHEHDWDLVDTWQHPARQPIHPRIQTAIPSTFVLAICKGCHMPQSIELEGQWTIEQVRGQSEQL